MKSLRGKVSYLWQPRKQTSGTQLAISQWERFRPEMPRFKRSLPPRPSVQCGRAPKRPSVLHEGFAIQPTVVEAPLPDPSDPHRGGIGGPGEPRPYGRGSAQAALFAARNPEACTQALWADASSSTSIGPTRSRQNLWAEIGKQAGIENPFDLTPSTIYVIMGALKTAGYRSAAQYLEAAKAVHVGMGFPWTAQLAQARRLAIRSCIRGMGSPKQAGGLPLPELADIMHLREPLASEGPLWPVRSTLLASWWLLREIEASRAMIQHITLDKHGQKATWRLPSSKTDQAALGAYRAHRCACGVSDRRICPFHQMEEHLQQLCSATGTLFPSSQGTVASKQGWADTFQAIAMKLGLSITHANGARRFTGHSARVTGARHMASTNVELWRVQLFGRWGSDVFRHYIQDAPLSQLDSLAVETGAKLSIEEAKLQLQDLLRRTSAEASQFLATPPAEMIQDCEAAVDPIPQLPEVEQFVKNANYGGKLHRPLDCSKSMHPREWRTCCGWKFGMSSTDYTWIPKPDADRIPRKQKCFKCFPEFSHPTNSSESSNSSSTSASDAGGSE